ncbi:MAG: hypothetical protein CALGDGBN_00057 [Pseudomonadales bacterium]|nr:hypothetical protein [Pseudomonadales bacterium]
MIYGARKINRHRDNPRLVNHGLSRQGALDRALADGLRALGGERFPGTLADLLQAMVPADDVMVVLFREGGAPELACDRSAGREGPANVALYLKAAYLLDPFYRAFADGATEGCFRLQELAPAAFRSTEYYRLHYARTGISDEIGYLLHPAPALCVHVSLARRGPRARFTAAELRRLREFEPVLRELAARHWAPPPNGDARPLTRQLDSALEFFGRDFLTEREAEVLQLLLRGHSTKSIAERLRISPETVKLHRKHSYAKLDVCSQAELFHLFIDSLGSGGAWRGGDPLTGYLNRERPAGALAGP